MTAVLPVLLFLAQASLDLRVEEERAAVQVFNDVWENPSIAVLPCHARPIPPRLDFSYRFWAGFESSVKVRDLNEGTSRLGVFFRVKPAGESAQPVYFADSYGLKNVVTPAARELIVSGGFFLGPGKYDVDWLLTDPKGRFCKSHWSVSAKAPSGPSPLTPGAVESVGLSRWRGLKPSGGRERVTVFLHAASLNPRRHPVHLSGWDRAALIGSLTALLDLSNAASARVVVYDAAGRQILFRDEQFGPSGLRKLAGVLRDTNFGTVSYKTLTEGPGEAELIESLIREDRERPNPSGVLVFLGPELPPGGKLPAALVEWQPRLPRTYYLVLARMAIPQGDLIQKLVRGAKGRTFLVMRPGDLRGPIRAVAENR